MKGRAKLSIAFRRPGEPWRIVRGREAQTLVQLVERGPRGLSGLECGATRLSAYVFDLRHEFGLDIQAKTETHGGTFAGNHARYVLLSPVELGNVDAIEGKAA